MSRSGYTDDCDDYLAAGRWRGRLMSAMRGKRGQKLLRELRDALDAMPEKALIAHELVTPEGDCCALGCLAKAKGIDVSGIDPEDIERVASTFDIAEPLACEITFTKTTSAARNAVDSGRWKAEASR